MLLTLKIKNFALIAEQTIEFDKGFNVLVGETGAGKSLILDALGFVLGDKANKLNLRNGEQKMVVQAVFDNSSPEILNMLEEYDIEYDDLLIFTRMQNIDGKTECRVNGVIVPVSFVKMLAQFIVDVCVQNENVELMKVKNHISILDKYAGVSVIDFKNNIEKFINELNIIEKRMRLIGSNSLNRSRELELLSYQIQDIESANLKNGEDDLLKEEVDKLVNFQKVYDGLCIAKNSLNDLNYLLASVSSSLQGISGYDSYIDELYQRMDSVKIEADDISQSVNNYLSDFQYDESRLEELLERIDVIKTLKKKYGVSIEDINNYLYKIKNEYDLLLHGEEELVQLEKDKKVLREKIYEQCRLLSLKRRSVAIEIEKFVLNELNMVGFKNASFKIMFKELPSIDYAVFSLNGIDDVEFMFSANVGDELKSLSKTISGGEMSRFMLSVKNVFAKCFNTSVLVFDEVDTGISGEIGQRVAERLAVLSKSYQLICITHLCQVAAMADRYIYVYKKVEGEKTFTMLNYLQDFDIIKYLAVVSGATPTNAALNFAKEIKMNAEKFKADINV